MNKLVIFFVLVGIGCIIGLSPLMLYIHELGHLNNFTMHGIWAEITAPAITMTAIVTFSGLAAGCLSEFATFWILFWILLIVSNKIKQRTFWPIIGIPLGICTIVFFKAFYYTDFNREWSGDLQITWIAVVLPLLVLEWILAIINLARKD